MLTDEGMFTSPGALGAPPFNNDRRAVPLPLTDLAKGGYIEVSRERIVLLRKLPPQW